jgi:hypothetical protein
MPHPLALDATVATPLDAWTQLYAIPIPFLSGLLLRAFRCLCQHVVPATSILVGVVHLSLRSPLTWHLDILFYKLSQSDCVFSRPDDTNSRPCIVLCLMPFLVTPLPFRSLHFSRSILTQIPQNLAYSI